MSLIQEIKSALVTARKARDAAASSSLSTLVGEAEMVGKNAGNREPTDAEVTAVIKKFVKNIQETADAIASKGGAPSASLVAERELYERFLPKQLSADELKNHITAIHAGLVSTGEKADVGSIMRYLKKRFDGQFDGKLAAALIKEELS